MLFFHFFILSTLFDYSCDLVMKLNKQYILLIIILSISAGAFLLFPSFEREDFDTDIVEDISSGTISTTTTLNDESNSSIEEEIELVQPISNNVKHNVPDYIDTLPSLENENEDKDEEAAVILHS